MAAHHPRKFSNFVLSALPPGMRDAFASTLVKVELPRRMQLEAPRKKIEHVYFPEQGIASIVAAPARETQVEVGIIGMEGVTGLSVIHLAERSPYSSYMQVEGWGWCAKSDDVRSLMARSQESRRIFLAFAQGFLIQTAETAVANARASVEERLARWLLMAQDRVRNDEIGLTHEFLALMMAARRPGVTEAMHALGRQGLVRGARGRVVVLDRKGLIERAGAYYGVPEAELSRLLRN